MRDRFDIIVACDLNRGIGVNNQLPWRIPGDMKYFKNLTVKAEGEGLHNLCIMGRKTWESIPEKHRPLVDRYNLVLTRQKDYPLPEGVFKADSLDAALDFVRTGPVDRVFIIGGEQIYKEAVLHDRVGYLYLTEVRHRFECDAFFPEFQPYFHLISCSEITTENGIDYCFKVFRPNILGEV
ncbi:MAG: dihydrofolate reductase [Cyanobacteriota/Melainabacteria group bacterium]|nr:dihydrofolate reductase [Cyanobacteria bacterium HKST-UBA01]MCB9470831.1 dihydrofolate reductase [Candidatus Obscuribacterales bacterium]